MKRTIGVFAHVDAGKTTFCEALMYLKNQIKRAGRVDSGDTVMDYNELEKQRGITIFSDIAEFSHDDVEYQLIDTPGHVDFSAEMERALSVLDGAVLVISAADGVQSHTHTVFKLLREKKIPIYIFVNKLDQVGTDIQSCFLDIQSKLTQDTFLMKTDSIDEEFIEWLCTYNETLMEEYLEKGIDEIILPDYLPKLMTESGIVPVFCGSALKQQGIEPLLDFLNISLKPQQGNGDFAGRAFKVRYDKKGERIAFIKCLSGEIRLRQEIFHGGESHGKIHEIRRYRGENFQNADRIMEGDIAGVTGLVDILPGMGLGECADLPTPVLRPALRAGVLQNKASHDEVMEVLRRLEEEDPLLKIDYEPATKEITVNVMGKIQLEVLKELMEKRFSLDVDFGSCHVVYKETICEPIKGYGHFEPLRHYAEVHVRLEPAQGEGFSFKSELHTDKLGRQHQNLIRQMLLERDHKGMLTGSSLTDVCFVLANAAVHLKHTHGGDLREAAWRAVRQGLRKAKNQLMEPYYYFAIDVDTVQSGRVLSDITKRAGTFEPPETFGERTHIEGKGPVSKLMDYPAELLSFTKGTGAISMRLDGYYPCHNSEEVIENIGYQPERDMENTADSVFCAKGAGFEIKWHEAESYMHLDM